MTDSGVAGASTRKDEDGKDVSQPASGSGETRATPVRRCFRCGKPDLKDTSSGKVCRSCGYVQPEGDC